MSRKWVLTIAAAGIVLAACSDGPSREELASLAAKGYYDHLLRGEYEQFLAGKAGADSLPAVYREQLIEAYKQFMARQQQEHGGILSVRVATAKTDSLQPYTNVFLVLCFGDSINEQIAVPMVESGGQWRMK